jgi:hypothetical protein
MRYLLDSHSFYTQRRLETRTLGQIVSISTITSAGLFVARSQGDFTLARNLAEQANASRDTVQFLKASTPSMMTVDATGAALDERDKASAAFVAALRGSSVFVRVAEGMQPVPAGTTASVVTAIAPASLAAEGVPIVVSRLSLSGHDLEEQKVSAIVVVSSELARSIKPAAKRLIDASIKAGASAALDQQFVAVAVDGVTPTPATGTGSTAARNDLKAMLDSVNTSGASLFWLAAPDVANAASSLAAAGVSTFPAMSPTGGEMLNLPALVSAAIPAGTLMLLDASGFGGEIGEFEIDLAEHASVQMDDAPSNPPVAATVLASLWQRNLVGLRVTARFALERLRPDSVAVLSGIAWAAA